MTNVATRENKYSNAASGAEFGRPDRTKIKNLPPFDRDDNETE